VICTYNKDFEAEWDEFEFASFHHKNQSQLILFCANWLDPSNKGGVYAPDEHLSTQNYWVQRLEPLIGSNAYFVACNRTGVEKGTRFVGCSCVIKLGEKPALLQTFNREQQGIAVKKLTI
jgi:protein N-terminal amidase